MCVDWVSGHWEALHDHTESPSWLRGWHCCVCGYVHTYVCCYCALRRYWANMSIVYILPSSLPPLPVFVADDLRYVCRQMKVIGQASLRSFVVYSHVFIVTCLERSITLDQPYTLTLDQAATGSWYYIRNCNLILQLPVKGFVVYSHLFIVMEHTLL